MSGILKWPGCSGEFRRTSLQILFQLECLYITDVCLYRQNKTHYSIFMSSGTYSDLCVLSYPEGYTFHISALGDVKISSKIKGKQATVIVLKFSPSLYLFFSFHLFFLNIYFISKHLARNSEDKVSYITRNILPVCSFTDCKCSGGLQGPGLCS